MKEQFKNKKWFKIATYSIPLVIAILASVFNWDIAQQQTANDLFHDLLIWIGTAISFIGIVRNNDK